MTIVEALVQVLVVVMEGGSSDCIKGLRSPFSIMGHRHHYYFYHAQPLLEEGGGRKEGEKVGCWNISILYHPLKEENVKKEREGFMIFFSSWCISAHSFCVVSVESSSWKEEMKTVISREMRGGGRRREWYRLPHNTHRTTKDNKYSMFTPPIFSIFPSNITFSTSP